MFASGIDIGGANLKWADSTGRGTILPFPLWQAPEQLTTQLRLLLQDHPPQAALGVTLTGELCDCFSSRAEGVAYIVDCVEEVASHAKIWTTSGEWLSLAEARQSPDTVASANWHALASFIAKHWSIQAGLVLDIGSTTTDIIPILEQKPCPLGRTDYERLRTRELVYSGVTRTPVHSWGIDSLCSEYFANMQDVYLTLGDVRPDHHNRATPDGRPATREGALNRLARMLGTDFHPQREAEILALAREVASRQYQQLHTALETVLARLAVTQKMLIVSGSGEFLGKKWADETQVFNDRVLLFSAEFGEKISVVAPAYALARLLVEYVL